MLTIDFLKRKNILLGKESLSEKATKLNYMGGEKNVVRESIELKCLKIVIPTKQFSPVSDDDSSFSSDEAEKKF